MEVKKRAAAIPALCIMLLIISVPSKQQVAAMPFCDCYKQFHDGCRHSVPWWLCDGVDKKDALTACIMVCSMDSICDPSVAPTYSQGVADYIAECNKWWANN